MTRDEGRAFIRAHLDAQFGETHNISDEGSSRTQLVSFVLVPVAAGAQHHVLEVHEDLLDGDELVSQLEGRHGSWIASGRKASGNSASRQADPRRCWSGRR